MGTSIALWAASAPAAHADPQAIMIKYREATAVAVRCSRPADSREIVVCGRRNADRWRAPLIGYEVGDPRGESVSGERNRLASEPPTPCGNSIFLSGCGMVGVSMGMDLGSGKLKARTPAD